MSGSDPLAEFDFVLASLAKSPLLPSNTVGQFSLISCLSLEPGGSEDADKCEGGHYHPIMHQELMLCVGLTAPSS